MNIRVGYVPYLNMAPFYHGFGPQPVESEGRRYEFWSRTPRALGLEADAGVIDAAPLSLVDALRCESQYEPVADFGIGVKRAAQSVLLFSRIAMPLLHNAVIAVTDATSTSSLLLQLLLEQRYQLSGIRYGRIASAAMFDGEADGLLLIGDEALLAHRQGVRGLPTVTDLGEEWFQWKQRPFVFARWMVRRALAPDVKAFIETSLEKSLAAFAARASNFSSQRDVLDYWNGFVYRLEAPHQESIRQFSEMRRKQCLIA